MEFLGVGLAAGAFVVGVAAIKFASNILSREEKDRQNQLCSEYAEYERRTREQYINTCRYYENARSYAETEYEREISEYYNKIVQQNKELNRDLYDSRLRMYSEQFEEKKKLLSECRDIINQCNKNIKKIQNSYVRFNSIKVTILSISESVYKLEAYIEYLENYKKNLDKKYEDEGKLIEPFSFLLPEEYPYEGKVYFLEKTDFTNYGVELDGAGFTFIDESDHVLFDTINENSPLPFMVHISKKERKYLSLIKGLLKNSIGTTIGIDTEVVNINSKKIQLSFKGSQYPRIFINKSDLSSQYRRTPIGSNLHVYVKDYDFALNKDVYVSEKIGDGMTIAQFEYIALVLTEKEYSSFYDYLEKNDFLNRDDEWRIGPIENEDNELVGIILQQGNSYGIKVDFEEFIDGKLVLRYQGLLDKEELISFDDIFVATNVTLDCYTPRQIDANLEQYEFYFEECQKLRLYLISEFATQSRMMLDSPMSLYLNQWAEITNRLVNYMSYGANIKISVLEWKYFSIRNIGKYSILYIDETDEIAHFVEKENGKNRYKFFVELPGEKNTRIPCKLIEEEDGQKVIRLNGYLDSDTLLDNNFMLDMFSVSVPYAEKQHAKAFSIFKEGRVVSEKVKEAIIDTTDLTYQDNGYRLNELYNSRIQTNKNQLDAVSRALAEENFFMIQGPPGTGKTTVIKELILQQLKRHSSSRILIVSQANVAVDNVLRGTADISRKYDYIEESQIVRCGTIDKIAEDIEDFSFDKKYGNYLNRLQKNIPQNQDICSLRNKWINIINNEENTSLVGECLLNSYQIIGATCVGLESRHYGLNNMEFDLVIIDEAGKALAGELLIPINHAKKVILIGDHKQLPPVINTALYKGGQVEYDDIVEEEQKLDFLNRSFFQRLYEECPDNLKCMLDVQFRMPPVIANLVNLFYDGQLKTGENCFNKKPMMCGNHLIFIDMKNESDYSEIDKKEDGTTSSPFNTKEVEAAVNIVTKIRNYYCGRIVVITPYKRQKFELISGFKNAGCKNVWVNTIDAFQGDEEDVVIYCTTRAKKPTNYFSDSARLNVAFSRTKNTLIFLASSQYLRKYEKGHILGKVSDYLSENARIILYSEWMNPNFDLQFNSVKDRSDDIKLVQDMLPITSEFFDQVNGKKTCSKQLCKACGVELCEGEKILCKNCITKYEIHECKSCGKRIYLSYYDKYIHGEKCPELCENCCSTICSECHKGFYISKEYKKKLISQNKPLLCNSCREKYHKIAYRHYCEKCGEEISLTFAEKKKILDQDKSLPTFCHECWKKRNEMITIGRCQACREPITIKRYILEQYPDTLNTRIHKECENNIYMTKRCVECGNAFSITFGEKIYYERHGLDLPKRCKRCRKNR